MDSSEDKSYQPTPQKLLKARKRGEIVRSQELNTAALYLGFFLAITALGASTLKSGTTLLGKFWQRSISVEHLTISMYEMVHLCILVALVITAAPTLILLINLIRNGITFTLGNVIPKLNRISPLNGIKNKFGKSSLFDFLRGVCKSSILIFIIIYFVSPNLLDLSFLAGIEIVNSIPFLFSNFADVLYYVVIISAILGAVDFLWQHRQFIKKNMMSHQEVKEEFKTTEGDPHFKALRRQRGQELTSQQISVAVKEADVVIVNPTHFATALEWNPDKASAPIVSATGVDHLALRMRAIALEHRVPIYVDVPTARVLALTLKVGDTIPHEHFAAVAAAIRFSNRHSMERS